MNKSSFNFDQELALALFRFTLGINFFLHGATRIFGDLGKFIDGTVKGFDVTILPAPFVQLYATGLVFAELTIGILLILGLFTRFSLVLGALVMSSLVFGMSLRQEWNTVGTQMIYAICFFLLLFLHVPNRFSLDWLRNNRDSRN
jgi:thiosulfate dehydrogenase [quinone] large subunit